ncbi:MAG: hypothetical protein J5I93_02195 [Pirellulaceae bacterium]|nr:hypothetical protein [Pirellulaceae bacterium]
MNSRLLLLTVVLSAVSGCGSNSPTSQQNPAGVSTDISQPSPPNEAQAAGATQGSGPLILRGHTDSALDLCFNPQNPTQLASAGYEGKFRLWDTTTGRETRYSSPLDDIVSGVAFSLDGNRLATSIYDGTVKIWNVSTVQEQTSLRGHDGKVTGCVFHPTENRLASSGEDGTIRIWRLTNEPTPSAIAP